MFGVRRFRVSSHELRLLVGKFLALGNSYWLTRFVILRLLGFVYTIAFLVAANQLVPLIGEHGLTPATHFLNEVQTQLGSRSAGMLPVGLAYGTSETEALAKRMGLPLIAKFRAAYEPVNGTPVAVAEPTRQAEPVAPSVRREPILSAPAPGSMQGAQHHAGSVRSGQQVYARDRDLIVTGAIANGAEVIADGNIHIYGGLRGRAMAGAQGDEKARIYVSDFRAELVAIAGQYRVFEQIPDDLEGRSVQCWLEGEKLLIAKL